VVGCCECGDEPSGSCAAELVMCTCQGSEIVFTLGQRYSILKWP
jgi:hypothetical protein